MNLCEKLLNNFLYLCCCVVVFILLTRGSVTLRRSKLHCVTHFRKQCKLRYVAYNAFWLIFKWLFSKCTVDFYVQYRPQGGPTVDVLLIAFLQLGYG